MKEEWIQLIVQIAQRAGEKILDYYNSDYSIQQKDDNTPVTQADFASNTIITEGLKVTNIPILSEESNRISFDERKYFPFIWLVDPLDGTKEFIGKHHDFCINIALIENNRPVFGLIHIPFTREIIYAIKGKGITTVNEKGEHKPLQVREKRKNYIFLKSRSHVDDKLEQYILELKQRQPSVQIKTVGSAIKFCEIAKGNADEYTRFNPTMEWDTAAGQIIVEEAGKKLIDHHTREPIKYNRKNLKNGGFSVY